MNVHLKAFANSILYSISALFALNTFIFTLELSNKTVVSEWDFKLEKGTFFINNIASGFEFGKIETNILLGILFLFSVLLNFKYSPLKLEQIKINNK